MKTLNKTLLTLITGALLSTGANAAVNYTGNSTSLYTGVKVGQMNVKTDNVDFENATAFGLYAGYNFDQNFGAEIEYVTTDDTEYKNNLAGEYKADTVGAYGTYKLDLMNGLYAKGKLGYAQIGLALDGDEDNKFDGKGIAGGLGIGFNLTPNISIEGEYTKLPSIDMADVSIDTDLMSIGAHIKF